MKILYLDCFSGIAGDMFLGALCDAGMDPAALRRKLSLLGVKGYVIKTGRVKRGELSATKLDVVIDKGVRDERRSLKDITSIILRSRLDRDIKERSIGIFKSLAKAECIVHKQDLKGLHFHEVGDLDSIIDVVGAVASLKIMGIDKVYSSPVNLGGGITINTKGGVLPVPAPAALNLLKGIPVTMSDIKAELVTPTGAALLADFVEGFTDCPQMVLEGVGYGAGSNRTGAHPNCLRALVGESREAFLTDTITVMETTIDDMTPVDYEHLTERLFGEGALDVYLTPVQMKKTRPGILLTVLSEKGGLDRLSSVIFSESTTIGIRYYQVKRNKLSRKTARVKTRYGSVRMKVSSGPGGINKVTPEYDDYKKIAAARNVPLSKVRKELEKAWR